MRGKRVRRLLDQVMAPGAYTAQWAGRDDSGRAVASGSYLVRLRKGASVSVHKATLAK